jgi:phage protein D
MAHSTTIRVDGSTDTTVGAAAFIQVIERVGQSTQYRIEYSLDIADGDFPLLKDDKLGPGRELQLLVSTDETTECLVKGPIYGQEIHFEHGGGGSALIVLGADSLLKMDREDKAVAWTDVTDSDAVSTILSQSGMGADVETTNAGHFERKHTLIQRESDLAFVRRLARRNGNLFWVSCDASGAETAHFKRPPLDDNAKCEIVINLREPRSNVTSLDLTWDTERPISADSFEVDLNTKADISGQVQRSPLTSLGGNGLADILTDTRVVHLRAPVDDKGDLQARSEAALIESSFFVKASGSTTFSALKKVLRSHTLVDLQGVGSRHSGLWFCSAVKHSIDLTEHTMEFELIRNGWTN